MTACVIFSPRYASASAFIFARIIAEISGGLKVFSSLPTITLTCGVAVGGAHDFVRHALALLLDLVVLAAHEPLDGVNRVLRD